METVPSRKLVEAYIPCRFCDNQHIPLIGNIAGFKWRAKCVKCHTFYGFRDKAVAEQPQKPAVAAPPEPVPPEPDMVNIKKVRKVELPATSEVIDWRKYE